MTSPGRSVRRGRVPAVSRVPAVTVLLLVIVAVMAVGLAFGLSREKEAPHGLRLGSRAVLFGGGESGRYTRAELAALESPLPADASAVHVPVLMYHYVDAEPPPAGPYADGLTVRTPDFIGEMDYLAQKGYHTVTLADAYLAMAGIEPLPEKPVALTFDDGGRDNYEVAFPILKERGFTGTFFVITKTVGAEGQMTWDQLREMEAAGMSIQSHSVSHPGLTRVSDARLESELSESRAAITEALGEPGYALCYPSGTYDERVIAATRAAGYVMAVTTDGGAELGPNSVFEITRERVQAFLPLGTFAALVK